MQLDAVFDAADGIIRRRLELDPGRIAAGDIAIAGQHEAYERHGQEHRDWKKLFQTLLTLESRTATYGQSEEAAQRPQRHWPQSG